MKFTLARFNLVTPVLFLILFVLQATAQFTQQGSKLVGSGNVGTAQQGNFVALDSDGNTAIVGGYNDYDGMGAAWIWTRSGGVWSQQGSKLFGTGSVGGGSEQGSSVAISADGNTAIEGGLNDSATSGTPNSVGAVWVWTRSGGVWTQQGNKLVGTGYTSVAQQGTSVALSADGNTALVGGPGDGNNAGAVWVWTRSGGVWTQQGNKLVGKGVVGNGSSQGASVALSSDGNTAIVGGYYDNHDTGAVWVWTRSGGVWTQQGNKLVGSGAAGASEQGYSVSLSSDGNTAIVGGPYNIRFPSTGAAWVWTRSGGVWTQQGNKLVGSGAFSNATQGYSVALSSDGNTALVGGPTDSSYGRGATWVWTRSGGVWTQQGNKLIGSGANNDGCGNYLAEQGSSVALSSNGGTAMIGGEGDFDCSGAAWVFTQNVTSITPWTLSQKLSVQRLSLENGNSFRFDLPQKEHVVIQLFNSEGQKVSQLLDEIREAGNYTMPLSAESRGAYYLDFRAGDYHETMPIHH